MTRDPITVPPDAPIAAVARLLRRHCFNAVPVVAVRRLVGMVARADLLAILAGA